MSAARYTIYVYILYTQTKKQRGEWRNEKKKNTSYKSTAYMHRMKNEKKYKKNTKKKLQKADSRNTLAAPHFAHTEECIKCSDNLSRLVQAICDLRAKTSSIRFHYLCLWHFVNKYIDLGISSPLRQIEP